MTKEEQLKQEAEEYFKSICEDYNEEYERTGKRHYFVGFDIKNAYLASAEPREKRITELEKELEQAKKVQVVEHFEAYGQCRDSRRIASLETENAELKDKLNNLASVAEVRLANWQKYEKELKSEKEYNASLRKEIDEYTNSHTLCTKYKELKEQLYKARNLISSLCYVYQLGKNELATARRIAEAEQFLKENEYESIDCKS